MIQAMLGQTGQTDKHSLVFPRIFAPSPPGYSLHLPMTERAVSRTAKSGARVTRPCNTAVRALGSVSAFRAGFPESGGDIAEASGA